MNATDIVALVRADSDIVPPIELFQRRFPNIGISRVATIKLEPDG